MARRWGHGRMHELVDDGRPPVHRTGGSVLKTPWRMGGRRCTKEVALNEEAWTTVLGFWPNGPKFDIENVWSHGTKLPGQAAVLHPETHYKYHFSSNPEYARALTDAIEKMAETPEDVQAITEFGVFRESLGRFSRPIARAGASSMTPSPNLDDLYSSQLDKSARGRSSKNGYGKRVREDKEEIEFLYSSDGDEEEEFEDLLSDGGYDIPETNSDDGDHGNNHVETSPIIEGNKEASGVQDGNASGRRSARFQKKKKVQALY
nr:unnamed protein product [Digitaria exilis]